jgi:excisionase family DNA binding protein
MPNDNQQLLTSAEVSQTLGMSQQTILAYAKSNKLQSIKINRQYRFTQGDVQKFVDGHRKGR